MTHLWWYYKNSSFWHFDSWFVLKTTKTKVFDVNTEIFWQTFWCNNWRCRKTRLLPSVKIQSFWKFCSMSRLHLVVLEQAYWKWYYFAKNLDEIFNHLIAYHAFLWFCHKSMFLSPFCKNFTHPEKLHLGIRFVFFCRTTTCSSNSSCESHRRSNGTGGLPSIWLPPGNHSLAER